MAEAGGDIARLLGIMAALRDPRSGCPWDVRQDFASIAPYTIEEAYEVADAIGRGDLDDLRDELGDLLLLAGDLTRHGTPAEAECVAKEFADVGVPVIAVLHGAGNGLITIAKGTLPLAIFGPAGYGRRNGILSVPTRIAEASAPLLFGLLLAALGSEAVLVTAALCLSAFASLLLLRARSAPDRVAPSPGN